MDLSVLVDRRYGFLHPDCGGGCFVCGLAWWAGLVWNEFTIGLVLVSYSEFVVDQIERVREICDDSAS